MSVAHLDKHTAAVLTTWVFSDDPPEKAIDHLQAAGLTQPQVLRVMTPLVEYRKRAQRGELSQFDAKYWVERIKVGSVSASGAMSGLVLVFGLACLATFCFVMLRYIL